jgi:hypothetical protein
MNPDQIPWLAAGSFFLGAIVAWIITFVIMARRERRLVEDFWRPAIEATGLPDPRAPIPEWQHCQLCGTRHLGGPCDRIAGNICPHCGKFIAPYAKPLERFAPTERAQSDPEIMAALDRLAVETPENPQCAEFAQRMEHAARLDMERSRP